MKKTPIRYRYTFTFPNGSSKKFELLLDYHSLSITTTDRNQPEWAKLEKNRCCCCTLSQNENSYCPIASNLSELVISFKDTASYESCHVTCESDERVISKETIVQEGLSSIMGIIMATSGCPIMGILKPMARFHLPFATVDEAMFRSISVYLLRQFFIYLEQGESDFHLENVTSYYSKIEQVNEGILKRIKHATRMDADKNAIVILNCLAQILHIELEDNLSSLRHIFKSSL